MQLSPGIVTLSVIQLDSELKTIPPQSLDYSSDYVSESPELSPADHSQLAYKIESSLSKRVSV